MYDLIVIGAGVAGYTAAIKAAKAGLKTAIAESENVGGTCLNRGCIPTKYMVSEMHRFKEIQNRLNCGSYIGSIDIDYAKTISGLSEKINRLTSGIKFLLKSNGIDIYEGHAEFIDERKIVIHNSETVLESRNYIIATGSKPNIFSNNKCGKHIFTTDNVCNEMAEITDSMTIVGGGAVGLEFAFIYSGLGCKVMILEQKNTLLGDVDKDLDAEMMKMLRQNEIDCRLNCSIDEIFENENGIIVTDEEENTISQTDVLLLAAGRTPNCCGLGLEKVGVEFSKRGIVVDEKCKTTNDNIYAVGDVNGKNMLAYTATAQAINAISYIGGGGTVKDENLIPICIFADCETAYVGVTEMQAEKKGKKIRTAKFLMSANGRSTVEGKGGFIKIVEDSDNGEIIGGVCVCANASEIINCVTLAIKNHMTVQQFVTVVFPHPTFSEALTDAAEHIDGNCIYMM